MRRLGTARNIKLTLEYDGSMYHGWQAQSGSGRATIQETLEQAISRIAGEIIKTHSSGRTDAGVHAFGHVANFLTQASIPPTAWAPALNHLLPVDIRVLESAEVPGEFDARYSALSKVYKYRILNRRAPSALERYYAWHVNIPLKLHSMRQAAQLFLGRHDFSAFRSSGCGAKSPVRTIKRIEVKKKADFVEIWVQADSFLQYMVRNITGTLVEVGLGRFKPADVKQILASRNRSQAGRTAPACGLYLVQVNYKKQH